MIEEMLRETFRAQVAQSPAVDAMADRAVRMARRTRRRRLALATGAAAMTVALGVGYAVTGPGLRWPSVSPLSTTMASPAWLPTTPITSLPVDVVVGRYLFLAGGGVLSLDNVAPCEDGQCLRGVWRVADGYLVSVYQPDAPVGAAALWHVPDAGSARVVVDGDGALIVGRGTARDPHIHVVWSDDGRLHAGVYDDHRVVNVVSTPAPEVVDRDGPVILRPQVVVGGAVALTGGPADDGMSLSDVWFPDQGDYEPAVYPATGFHGITADGERIIGWHASAHDASVRCLSEVLPEKFEPVRSLCPSPFTVDARIYPSADGQWWFVIDAFPFAGANRRGPGVAIFDAERVWQGADLIRSWPMPQPSLDGVWLATDTFVVVDRVAGNVVSLFTDGRPETTVALPMPAQGANVMVVPDLR